MSLVWLAGSDYGTASKPNPDANLSLTMYGVGSVYEHPWWRFAGQRARPWPSTRDWGDAWRLFDIENRLQYINSLINARIRDFKHTITADLHVSNPSPALITRGDSTLPLEVRYCKYDRSSDHSCSRRICSSSSGVKSLVMLKVERISSGVLPLIKFAIACELDPTSGPMSR